MPHIYRISALPSHPICDHVKPQDLSLDRLYAAHGKAMRDAEAQRDPEQKDERARVTGDKADRERGLAETTDGV
jgi:hypothetical protein